MARHVAMPQPRGGCRKACIDARDGPAIGLVLAMGREIGRGFGEFLDLVGDVHIAPVERQFGAEAMELVQIEAERMLALQQQGLTQCIRRHEGIAVAIAADPAPHAQEGRNLHIAPGGIHGRELVLQGGVNVRQFLEEGIVVIGQAVRDLVDHFQPVPAQNARLPEREDGAAQGFLTRRLLLRCQALTVPPCQNL